MKSSEFWNIDNVSKFKDYDVENGEVTLSDSEYVDILNDIYGTVTVCGQNFDSGRILEELDPTAFRCGKGEYESQLDTELSDQLDREDSDDIEFIDGDEWELDDDEDESDDE